MRSICDEICILCINYQNEPKHQISVLNFPLDIVWMLILIQNPIEMESMFLSLEILKEMEDTFSIYMLVLGE